MIIETRTSEMTDTLEQLRELFPSYLNEANPLEVPVRDYKDASEFRDFASMSGFKTALYHNDGYNSVSITGASCGCCR